jgi:hypothetical protein
VLERNYELWTDREVDLLLDESLAQHSPSHHMVGKVNLPQQ